MILAKMVGLITAAGIGTLLTPFRKTVSDLSGTRTQIVLVVLAIWLLAAWKTYTLVRTVAEGVALLGAMNTAVMAVITGWVLTKGIDGAKTIATTITNGKPKVFVPTADAAPSKDVQGSS